MDRLFRQSGLYREKWERSDYSKATLENAVLKRKIGIAGYKTKLCRYFFRDYNLICTPEKRRALFIAFGNQAGGLLHILDEQPELRRCPGAGGYCSGFSLTGFISVAFFTVILHRRLLTCLRHKNNYAMGDVFAIARDGKNQGLSEAFRCRRTLP